LGENLNRKRLYVFDVEGTLEARPGWDGIPLDRLRELREEGVVIYIVGAYDVLSPTTTEFPNGWYGGDKVDSLRWLSDKHPDATQKIYFGDKDWDKWAAEQAGWHFVWAWDFDEFMAFMRKSDESEA
jgi:hypothetical protein